MNRKPFWIIGFAIGLAGLILYAATVYPDVGGTLDSPEFQIAGKQLGLTHPTGYPFYMLISNLAGQAPGGTLAVRIAMISAAGMALMAVVLWGAAWKLSGSAVFSAAAVLSWMVRPAVWSAATVAEVYALQILLTAGIAFFLIEYLSDRRNRSAEALVFLLGLGFVHHLMTVVLLIGAGLAILTAGRVSFHSLRRWVDLAILFLIPLLYLLYIPLRAWQGAHSFDLYNFSSLGDVIRFCLGGSNTGLLHLDLKWFMQEGFTNGIKFFLEQFGIGNALLATLGAFDLLRRRRLELIFLAWTMLVHIALAGIWTEADREAVILQSMLCGTLLSAVGAETLRIALLGWLRWPILAIGTLLFFMMASASISAWTTYSWIAKRNAFFAYAADREIEHALPPRSIALTAYWEKVNFWKYMIESGEYEDKDLCVYRWNDPRANADWNEIGEFLNGAGVIGPEGLQPDPTRRIFMLEPPIEPPPPALKLKNCEIRSGIFVYEITASSSCLSKEDEAISLLQLPWSVLEWSWQEPSVNHSLNGNLLKIAGEVFIEGLGIHGGTKIRIPVPPDAKRFRAFVGSSDDLPPDAPVSVEFLLLAQDAVLAHSPLLRRNDKSFKLECGAEGLADLILEVTGGVDGVRSDHAVIGDPCFFKK
ncbi:MAG: NPCBM/NEW2 domain-containing protein [Candidatus Omnitrophota bacterium]